MPGSWWVQAISDGCKDLEQSVGRSEVVVAAVNARGIDRGTSKARLGLASALSPVDCPWQSTLRCAIQKHGSTPERGLHRAGWKVSDWTTTRNAGVELGGRAAADATTMCIVFCRRLEIKAQGMDGNQIFRNGDSQCDLQRSGIARAPVGCRPAEVGWLWRFPAHLDHLSHHLL